MEKYVTFGKGTISPLALKASREEFMNAFSSPVLELFLPGVSEGQARKELEKLYDKYNPNESAGRKGGKSASGVSKTDGRNNK